MLFFKAHLEKAIIGRIVEISRNVSNEIRNSYGITDPRIRSNPSRTNKMVQAEISEISTWSWWKSDDGAGKVIPVRVIGRDHLPSSIEEGGRPICRSNNWTRNRITFILITRRGQATKRNARSEVGSALLPNPSTSCVISPRAPPRTHFALCSSLPLRFDPCGPPAFYDFVTIVDTIVMAW